MSEHSENPRLELLSLPPTTLAAPEAQAGGLIDSKREPAQSARQPFFWAYLRRPVYPFLSHRSDWASSLPEPTTLWTLFVP
jgi:hypothetical protein